MVAAFQGAKDPRAVEFVNPYEQLLKQAEAKERLDRRVAKTFLALSKENKIPTWVVSYVDVQLIRNAAK